MTELRTPGPRIFDDAIESLRAWTRREVSEERWLLPIPVAALKELDEVIRFVRANPLDLRLLSPDDFSLSACRELIQRVKALLDNDLGVVVLDRLPADIYSKDELTTAYWLLSSMIARPVAQAF